MLMEVMMRAAVDAPAKRPFVSSAQATALETENAALAEIIRQLKLPVKKREPFFGGNARVPSEEEISALLQGIMPECVVAAIGVQLARLAILLVPDQVAQAAVRTAASSGHGPRGQRMAEEDAYLKWVRDVLNGARCELRTRVDAMRGAAR